MKPFSRAIAAVVFLVFAACAVACAQDAGRRMARPESAESPDSLPSTLDGAIVGIESMLDRDGPLYIFLDCGDGEPVKLVFGSMRTRPRPSDDRTTLYEKVIQLRVGDRIRAQVTVEEGAYQLSDVAYLGYDGYVMIEPRSNEGWLLLYRDVPLGLSQTEVGHMFRMLGPVLGLSEATARRSSPVQISGRHATLEFNFTDEVLISYYFNVDEDDDAMARDLYNWLRSFYSERLGAPAEDPPQDPEVASRTCVWNAKGATLTLTSGVIGDTHRVTWAFTK